MRIIGSEGTTEGFGRPHRSRRIAAAAEKRQKAGKAAAVKERLEGTSPRRVAHLKVGQDEEEEDVACYVVEESPVKKCVPESSGGDEDEHGQQEEEGGQGGEGVSASDDDRQAAVPKRHRAPASPIIGRRLACSEDSRYLVRRRTTPLTPNLTSLTMSQSQSQSPRTRTRAPRAAR